MTEHLKTTLNVKGWSYLWLLIGAISYLFGNGKWIIPLAAWLWPIFMLRFIRTQKLSKGLIVATVVFILEVIISWHGALRAPFPLFIIMAVIIGIITMLPFLLDGLIVPRFQGLLSTIVLPLAWTTVDYVVSFGPYSNWGSMAFTQYGNLPLMQVVSVTGIYGIVFLIIWFAAVVNWAWEHEFVWREIRSVACLYACILALVLILGGSRLAFFPPESKTIRVASITTPDLKSQSIESRKFPPLEKTINVMENYSEQAARAGAKIVFWQEYGALLGKNDKGTFIDRGCMLAIKEKIYLILGMGVLRPEPGVPGENKIILIDPSGKVMWKYWKHHPAPEKESPTRVQGKGDIPVLNTPLGKIASVICFDLDFPNYIRQAGKAGIDIMLVPSFDWREITPLHTHMAVFRAIENGFSMIRCTGDGLSMAVDYQGRTVSALNYFNSDEHVMISDVPSKGVTTIYPQIGDLFAWLCCTCFIIIIAWTLLHRKKLN